MPGIDECLLEAMRLPGAHGAAVVDWTSGLALGTVGDSPNGDHETTAAETAELARLAAEQPAFAPGDGPPGGRSPGGPPPGGALLGSTAPGGTLPVEDVIVTNRGGYHLLRFVETSGTSGTPGVFLYVWLDRDTGNLALARIRLRDLAERLVL
ncbi:hypothetical protein [Streptomyces sp. NPDC050504]|uniref:hypothetical protein n=1 Tax=Streptomyces sp. NPDC050504 TaxID=3365618 RepID=UPI00379C9402